MRTLLDDDVQERLFSKFAITDGCWEWTAARNARGYGLFTIERGHQISAHRAVYISLRGEIPSGLVTDHLCRNPGCVRPDHLDVVTQRENVLRGVSPAAWNAVVRACRRGHRYDQSNTYRTPSGGRQCRTCRRRS